MLARGLFLHIGASISWNRFTVHWSTVVGLAALAALYEWRAHREIVNRKSEIEKRAQFDSRFPILDFRLRFYAGLAVIFLSLNGWLHDLSDWYLFSAHMVQHLLLTLLVPPLLIAGTPGWMLRPALSYR